MVAHLILMMNEIPPIPSRWVMSLKLFNDLLRAIATIQQGGLKLIEVMTI